ncbi:hypothetical protein FVEN_g12805 [Fusarium venenatum]|nr:hypothetical protein FVEN_g12805 [Fusarium venenatum]
MNDVDQGPNLSILAGVVLAWPAILAPGGFHNRYLD